MVKLPTTKFIFFLGILMLLPGILLPNPYSDSIENIQVEWSQLITIERSDKETIQVLNCKNAYHEPVHGYLPVIKLKLESVFVDSVSVTFHDKISFSQEEISILETVDWGSIKLANINTYYNFKDPVSEISIVPIDTAGGFQKPGSITIHYYYNQVPIHNISYSFYKNEKKTSVLAEGEWIKVAVVNEGVHKITADFLKNCGINLATLDPKKIRLFGNGGKMLPQSNSTNIPSDLIENAIKIVGEEDGKFDANDYILFYGQNPHLLQLEASKSIIYNNHPYSDTTYYFLNYNLHQGKRIQKAESLTGTYPEIHFYDDVQAYEKNQKHILASFPNDRGGSGRNWYGEDMTSGRKEVKVVFNVKGLRANSEVKVVSSLAASSRSSADFTLRMGSQQLGKQNLYPIIEGDYFDKATYDIDTFKAVVNTVPSDGKLSLSLTYDNPVDNRTIGFLDFLLINCERELALYSPQNLFYSLQSLKNDFSKFIIKNVSESVEVWNVTDELSPQNQTMKLEGSNGSFVTSTEQLKKFVIFDKKADLHLPTFVGKVENQNLHGETTPNLLIITHNDFLNEALRLADFRRSHNGYSVTVATTEQVYNEFSSGSQDVSAIRNYVKYLYDRGGNDGLKYLLLFGKPSFDFKNILEKGKHFVPTYESRNSSHPIYSYSSDDYFGFMGDDEGEWSENFTGDHILDIGVGRLPVSTVEDAQVIVDKLIHYSSSPATYGNWRKQVYFIADDQDNNSHLNDAEKLVNQVESGYPQYDMNKIYLDAYPQVGKPNERSPETTRAINEMIEKGALMVNFIGHGSPHQWMDEQVLNINTINEWKNLHKLPLFVTATCQFGRQDNPMSISGAEYMLFNPKGGAIGLVTTGRPVYASSNYNLNKAFYQAVFEMNGNHFPTVGDVFRYTKNKSLQGNNNRSFSLLADPSMTLAYPQSEVVVTSITAMSEGTSTDTVKALQKLKITGEIRSGGSLQIDFNGTLQASIHDKKSTVSTFGDKGISTTFKQWGNLIFNGGATVKNGNFSFELIAPKNISYQIGEGKMSLYAYDGVNKIDAGGAGTNIKVGGSIVNAPIDNTPPLVKLYMNDTTFRNGGLTSPNSVFLARLFDESGINISNSGIGQEITVSLDGETPIKVNHFYTSETDDYRKGWISYPIVGLTPGEHEIVFKAWDTYNNSTEERIKFKVGSDNSIEIRKLTSNPNPFRENTELSFEHNRAGDHLNVWAQLYSIRGELIRTLKFKVENSNSVVYLLNWDGSSDHGKKLETGLYIFRVFVRSLTDGSESSMTTKITLFN